MNTVLMLSIWTAAFRFFRVCLRLKNGNIFKHLIKHDVFKPILELTLRESKRDNLLSSSCLEFFDYMRRVRLICVCFTAPCTNRSVTPRKT